MIRLITLDVNNTILKFSSSPSITYSAIAAKYKVDISPEKLIASLKISLQEQLKTSSTFGSGTEGGWQNWWTCVVRNTFINSGLKENELQFLPLITKDLLHHYATKDSYSILPLAEDFLNFLSSKHCKIGAITNTDPRIKLVLKDYGLEKYFEFVLDAYTAGISKPDPRIFAKSIELANINDLSAVQCLHIGDSLTKDYIGAKETGWKALFVSDQFVNQCNNKNITIDRNCMFGSLNELYKPIEELIL